MQDSAKPVTSISFPAVTICSEGLDLDAVTKVIAEEFKAWKEKRNIREDINLKKRFLSGIARMMWGGGVYPCPNFLALFLEVHFWSIKRVYFFKNANVLNF